MDKDRIEPDSQITNTYLLVKGPSLSPPGKRDENCERPGSPHIQYNEMVREANHPMNAQGQQEVSTSTQHWNGVPPEEKDSQTPETDMNIKTLQLQKFFDYSPVAQFLSNHRGEVLLVNGAWKKLFGDSIEENAWMNHIHSNDRASVEEGWWNMLASGNAYKCEFRLLDLSQGVNGKRKSGNHPAPVVRTHGHIWVQLETQSFQDLGAVCFAGSVVIAERKKELETMKNIFNAIPDPIVSCNSELVCTCGNSAVGFHQESFLGRTIQDSIFRNFVNASQLEYIIDIFRNKVKQAFEENQIVTTDYTWWNKNYSGVFVPFQNEVTEEREVLCVGRDVTSLVEVKQNAEATCKAISEFYSFISHEIRNPLNAMTGAVSLLQAKYRYSQEEDQTLWNAVDESEKMISTIVNNVLDYSKFQAGKFELQETLFSLRKTLESIMVIFDAKASEKHLTLSYHIDHNCPDKFRGDHGKIKQIISNFLSNAIKFTNSGGIEIVVRVDEKYPQLSSVGKAISVPSEDKDTANVIFSVSDTGCGLPTGYSDWLFSPFEQGRRGVKCGSGLGLYLTKMMIEGMGGAVGVSTKLNEGSTFEFSVPLKIDNTEVILEEVATPPHKDPSDVYVLLVEDDPTNRMVTLRMLQNLNYQCDAASSGKQALEHVQRQKCDVVLMDIMMQDMDGFATTRLMREMLPQELQPKIIALSGCTLAEDVNKCYLAGMNDFLPKPVRLEHLKHVMAVHTPL